MTIKEGMIYLGSDYITIQYIYADLGKRTTLKDPGNIFKEITSSHLFPCQYTAPKMKFPIKDFSSKFDLRIW